jgi:hypothetical protein
VGVGEAAGGGVAVGKGMAAVTFPSGMDGVVQRATGITMQSQKAILLAPFRTRCAIALSRLGHGWPVGQGASGGTAMGSFSKQLPPIRQGPARLAGDENADAGPEQSYR